MLTFGFLMYGVPGILLYTTYIILYVGLEIPLERGIAMSWNKRKYLHIMTFIVFCGYFIIKCGIIWSGGGTSSPIVLPLDWYSGGLTVRTFLSESADVRVPLLFSAASPVYGRILARTKHNKSCPDLIIFEPIWDVIRSTTVFTESSGNVGTILHNPIIR